VSQALLSHQIKKKKLNAFATFVIITSYLLLFPKLFSTKSYFAFLFRAALHRLEWIIGYGDISPSK